VYVHVCALFTCYLLLGAPGCLTESVKQPPKKTLTELDSIFGELQMKHGVIRWKLKGQCCFLVAE